MRLQYSQDFTASDTLHLCNSMGVTKDYTNLWGGQMNALYIFFIHSLYIFFIQYIEIKCTSRYIQMCSDRATRTPTLTCHFHIGCIYSVFLNIKKTNKGRVLQHLCILKDHIGGLLCLLVFYKALN